MKSSKNDENDCNGGNSHVKIQLIGYAWLARRSCREDTAGETNRP